ncbi:hypothetical protein, partial [Salmonella sp. s54925]|uniref:hypothetical protein n=1 Tax=Salmonella sp. s54925 TaxID=3159674 RepID=UPI003980F685
KTLIGVIISCSCLFVFIILVVIIRFRSSDSSIIYADIPGHDPEISVEEEKTVLNVTLNPMGKFEDTDVKDETKDKKPGKEIKTEKMNLEWDDAYIA